MRERVVDSGAHGDDVGDEENEENVAPFADLLFVVLEQQVDDVERQPADDEDGHHGDQHAVGASTAADLLLLTTACSSRHDRLTTTARATAAAAGHQAPLGARSTSQRGKHTPVTDNDDGPRHQVLQYEATAQCIQPTTVRE